MFSINTAARFASILTLSAASLVACVDEDMRRDEHAGDAQQVQNANGTPQVEGLFQGGRILNGAPLSHEATLRLHQQFAGFGERAGEPTGGLRTGKRGEAPGEFQPQGHEVNTGLEGVTPSAEGPGGLADMDATSDEAPFVGEGEGEGFSVEANCTTLLAGQTLEAGAVCVAVVDGELHVLFEAAEGFTFSETHLWVGLDLADMPQTANGNPKIGTFPYTSGDITGATSFEVVVDLGSLGAGCGDLLNLAAHAVVVDAQGVSETAWGAGEPLNAQGSWAMSVLFELVCETPETPQSACQCETAYAFGETAFIELGLTDSRWGWQLGPISQGTFEAPIFAGAGQNDLSKGEQVGALVVDYTGEQAVVSFEMRPGVTLDETHLFVGAESVDAIAPGQLGHAHDLEHADGDAFLIDGLDGQPLFIVAHAVVCAR